MIMHYVPTVITDACVRTWAKRFVSSELLDILTCSQNLSKSIAANAQDLFELVSGYIKTSYGILTGDVTYDKPNLSHIKNACHYIHYVLFCADTANSIKRTEKYYRNIFFFNSSLSVVSRMSSLSAVYRVENAPLIEMRDDGMFDVCRNFVYGSDITCNVHAESYFDAWHKINSLVQERYGNKVFVDLCHVVCYNVDDKLIVHKKEVI